MTTNSAPRASLWFHEFGSSIHSSESATLGLRDHDVDVVAASDAAALADRRPDVIVVGMSGLTEEALGFLQTLRTDPMRRDIPTLAWFAGTATGSDQAAAYEAGATSVVDEPTSPELIAALVGALLNSRDRQRELELALSRSGSGIFDWVIPTGEVRWTPSLERMHGMQPGEFGGTFEDFVVSLHPDDADRVGHEITQAIDEGGDKFEILFRAMHRSGEPLWIEGHGKIFRNRSGDPVKLLGLAIDATAREENVRQLDLLARLAADLNACQTTEAVVEALAETLQGSGIDVVVRAADDAPVDGRTNVLRRETEHFVVDVATSARLADGLDRRQIAVVADLAENALHRTRRYESQRHAARMLQRALLPVRLPSPDGWAVSAHYESAVGPTAIGGDFYDAIDVSGTLVVLIGDVEGHGLAATAQVGLMRNLLRTLAVQYGARPVDILRRASELMPELCGADAPFVTTGIVSIETATGRIAYASAGHLPPILRAGSSAHELARRPTFAPLGSPFAFSDARAVEATMRVGDAIVLYTDGAIERREEPIDRSIRRLAEAAVDSEVGDLRAERLLERVQDASLNDDDRAIVVVERLT
jgi:PAS domain S-box-containing protein